MWLNIFRASPRPSLGAYNGTRSLWFYRWREAVGALLVVVWRGWGPCWSWSARPRPTTLQPLLSNGRTRGSWCSCKLLMMGGKTPETFWATHKRQVINFWNCCILLVELFELNNRIYSRVFIHCFTLKVNEISTFETSWNIYANVPRDIPATKTLLWETQISHKDHFLVSNFERLGCYDLTTYKLLSGQRHVLLSLTNLHIWNDM